MCSKPNGQIGRVKALWLKRMKRGPMDPINQVVLAVNKGLVGNADQGGRRQVTILEHEMWAQVMGEVQGQLPPVARRANVLIEGLRLARSCKRVLVIGPCRVRVLGETKPCERMEEAHSGLRSAMAQGWAGGVFGEVLEGGIVRVGDTVAWETT